MAKIGLIASFEGPNRALGYDAIFAARLALREANAGGGAAGWALELVALDDSGSLPLALRQVRALGADPDVAAAVHLVSLPVATELSEAYRGAGVPAQFIGSGAGTELPDSDFSNRYAVVSQGMAPTSLSIRAYHSVQSAIQQIAERVRLGGRPGRMR